MWRSDGVPSKKVAHREFSERKYVLSCKLGRKTNSMGDIYFVLAKEIEEVAVYWVRLLFHLVQDFQLWLTTATWCFRQRSFLAVHGKPWYYLFVSYPSSNQARSAKLLKSGKTAWAVLGSLQGCMLWCFNRYDFILFYFIAFIIWFISVLLDFLCFVNPQNSALC